MDSHYDQVMKARQAQADADTRLYFAYSTILDRRAFEQWRQEHGYTFFDLPAGKVGGGGGGGFVYPVPPRRGGGGGGGVGGPAAAGGCAGPVGSCAAGERGHPANTGRGTRRWLVG